MKMMPPLKDDPVKAHLLMSSMDIELVLKSSAAKANLQVVKSGP